MSAAYYTDLPWSSDPRDEARLRRLVIGALLFTLIIGFIVPWISLPKPVREEAEKLPPRVAQVILEKRQLPPPPPPPPPVEQPASEPVPEVPNAEAPKPKEEAPPTPAPAPTPAQKDVTAARKKAANSGLLALQNELTALRSQSIDTQVFTRPQQRAFAQADSTSAPSNEEPRRSFVTANAGSGSGGIDSAKVSKETGAARLANREVTQVQSQLNTRAGQNANSLRPSGKGRKAGRSSEEIQLVFDRNKGAIYSIYNRALRTDPTLQGKLVLQLTIAASGKVLACKALSSELDAPALVKSVITRVTLFDFGPAEGDTTIVTYPIDFLPS